MNKRVSKAIVTGIFATVIGFTAQAGSAAADAGWQSTTDTTAASATASGTVGAQDAGWQSTAANATAASANDAGWQ